MKEKVIRRSSGNLHKGQTDWARIDQLTDADIEAAVAADPDAPAIVDRAWFEAATLVLPEPKEAVSLRLDRDVLGWFRDQGPGYQSRMNAVLRQFAQAHGAGLTGRSARAPRRPRKSAV